MTIVDISLGFVQSFSIFYFFFHFTGSAGREKEVEERSIRLK
jgi:hypothetical protein